MASRLHYNSHPMPAPGAMAMALTAVTLVSLLALPWCGAEGLPAADSLSVLEQPVMPTELLQLLPAVDDGSNITTHSNTSSSSNTTTTSSSSGFSVGPATSVSASSPSDPPAARSQQQQAPAVLTPPSGQSSRKLLQNVFVCGNDALNAHNTYRVQHQGTPTMSWDSNLAQQAAQWSAALASEGCTLRHDANTDSGENLYTAWGSTTRSCTAGINSWYDEIRLYNYNTPGFSMETGHFTQLVWVGSTRLGCGIAEGRRNGQYCYVLTCRYGPAGNMEGQFAANVRPLGGSTTTPAPTPRPPPSNSGPALQLRTFANKCVDIRQNGQSNGVVLQQYDCNGTGAQRFVLEDTGNLWFRIREAQGGRCLDVAGQDTRAGTRLQMWQCYSGNNQKFGFFSVQGTKRYFLKPLHALANNMCMDVQWSNTGNEAVIQLWPCNGTPAQQFALNQV